MDILSSFNYWAVIILMMIGFYIIIANNNLVKKIIGINIFQTSIFIMFISMGKVIDGTAPILSESATLYSSPLPHVLILTAIVVGISTTALALAIIIRIHTAFGTIEDDKIQPALQGILPLAAAPLCVILHHRTLAWVIALLVSIFSFCISCALFNQVLSENTITYAMGGWVAPWGIEYYIDKLTAYMLLIINGVAVLVLLGARRSIENEIASDRIYLFYTTFLLNLTGLLGVITTGDAFNLFVFIEIASLSSYAMISLGKDKRSLYAAFKYLIFGTIGASFILISVGLLYVVTGTLNIVDLSEKLLIADNRATITTAFVFFVVGIGIKAAIFPLHLWLPDAYTYSPSIVSTFLAGTTTKVFIYVLIRFVYSLEKKLTKLKEKFKPKLIYLGNLLKTLFKNIFLSNKAMNQIF